MNHNEHEVEECEVKNPDGTFYLSTYIPVLCEVCKGRLTLLGLELSKLEGSEELVARGTYSLICQECKILQYLTPEPELLKE